MSWKVDCVVVGPIQCNCYILHDPVSLKAFLIDPGAESEDLLVHLQQRKFDLQAILVTHAHLDHVGGIEMVLEEFPCPVYYHSADKPLYDNLLMQAQLFGMTPRQLQARQPKAGEGSLQHEQTFPMEGAELQVIHTPGHTPGSVCFQMTGEKKVVFSGDTLFEGSIGRTDLWGGSYDQIIQSIQERLMVLEDTVMILPGHGAETMIGAERRYNPFLVTP